MDTSPPDGKTEISHAGPSLSHHVIYGMEDLTRPTPGADLLVTQLTAAPCRGELSHAAFGDITTTLGRLTGDLRLRGSMAAEAVTLALILEQTEVMTHWGHDALAGDLLVFPPRGEQEAQHRGLTRYAALQIPRDDLMRRVAAFDDLAEDRHWRDGARLRPPSGSVLGEAVRRRLKILAAAGDRLSPQAADGLRETVIEDLLTGAAEAVRREPGRRNWINCARILRQVEDYLDRCPGRAVGTLELCQALALSRRSLHRAFREELGVGPKTYLRLRALSAARKALIAGRETGASVTQVALDHGFWELGRFSVTYRMMFGESPSQTLRGAEGGLERARVSAHEGRENGPWADPTAESRA